MNKKVFAVLAGVICMGCGALGFTGCLENEPEHTFKEQIIAPTCTKGGYTQYNCTDCDYFYRDNFTDPTGIHTPVTDGSVDPTCTESGLTEGSHCKDCNTVIVAQETINATGHKFTYTPDANGTTHSGKCGKCDEEANNVPHVYEGETCKDCGLLEQSDFEFELSNDKSYYIVTGLKVEKSVINIPSSFRGLPVKEIGQSAFSGKSISIAFIPTGVTKIGMAAFSRSALTRIDIPESVTEIGASAFNCCFDLENVSIPSGIIEIGNYAFRSCFKLAKNEYKGCYYLGNTTSPYVYLLDKNSDTVYIHSQTKCIDREILRPHYVEFELDATCRTFKYVDNCLINNFTKTLVYGNENSVIPSDGSVVKIAGYAFNIPYAQFDVEIPNTVEIIKQYAFFDIINMDKLHIPASVKVIEQGAFFNSRNVTQITVDSANKNYYVKNNCLIEKDTKILIKGCSDSIIPLTEGITKIANYAFTGTEIENAILPDSVTTIGTSSFNVCKKLTELHAGNGLTTLGHACLLSCEISILHLPSTLQFIDSSALGSNTNLTINYDGTAAMWESIEKADDWNNNSNITVCCSDGEIIEYKN